MTDLRNKQLWKVGDLAERTGVSVRTLHYYEEIELLRPSHRTSAGHRLYTPADIRRLSHIKSLRQLGFSLDEIKAALDDPRFSPLGIVERQLFRLREQIAAEQRVCDRLEQLASSLRAGHEVGTEDLFKTIEAMTMYEKYFNEEQLSELRHRREAMGEDKLRESQQQWTELISAVRQEMQAGTDPLSAQVMELARKWRGLIEAFTGGNAKVEESVKEMYRSEPSMRSRFGLDPELTEYIGKALRQLSAQS